MSRIRIRIVDYIYEVRVQVHSVAGPKNAA